jgi:hypothetical protein
MRHFVDSRGNAATVKVIPIEKETHGGTVQRNWDDMLRRHELGTAPISRITIDAFGRGDVWVMRKSKSPWAGRWIATNHNPQHWIQLSAAFTEEGAITKYNAGEFDKDTTHKGRDMTPERMANARANNEREQMKHYGKTAAQFVETLPVEFQALTEGHEFTNPPPLVASIDMMRRAMAGDNAAARCMYLDYVNQFITVKGFSDYYGIGQRSGETYLNDWRGLHESYCAAQKVQ